MPGRAEIDPEKAREAQKLHNEGASVREICKRTGLSNWLARRALDPHMLTRERTRGQKRKETPERQDYERRYYDTDPYRERVKRKRREASGKLRCEEDIEDYWGELYHVDLRQKTAYHFDLLRGRPVRSGARGLAVIITHDLAAYLDGTPRTAAKLPVTRGTLLRLYGTLAERGGLRVPGMLGQKAPIVNTVSCSAPISIQPKIARQRMRVANAAPPLLGSYRAPVARRGDWLDDKIGGRVQVGGWTEAPIPWPRRLKTGRPSLIVTDELARAVRTESVEAICEYWGVGSVTVWSWRKALGVERMTEGTTAAVRTASASRTDSGSAVGLAAAHSPEARAKMAATKRGKPASAATRAALLAAAKRPKLEGWGKRASAWMRAAKERPTKK